MRAVHLWAFANHLGFPLKSAEDYVALHPQLIAAVEVGYRTPVGDYLVWSDKPRGEDYFGPEISIHINKNNELVGIMPFFRGHSDMMLGVAAPVPIANSSPLDGRLYTWVAPQDQTKLDSGVCPCAFDTPYLANFPEFHPHIWNYSITAFPVEPLLIRNPGDDPAATGNMPDQSFIPIGLFPPEGTAPKDFEPQPYARFSGVVSDARVLTNPVTGRQYQWALVQTLGGTIDVVAHDEMAPQPIEKGQVLGGVFWVIADQYEPENN